MAKLEWSTGIDSVSGALSKPSKSGQHSCTKMLLGTHRVAATTSNACTRLYLRKKTHRSTPRTANEVANQERFSAVSALIKARKADLSLVSTDTAAFLAQKDQAGGKKTMLSYYWSICGAQYDAQQG